MTDRPIDTQPGLAQPLQFDTAAGWCFGWFHAPAGPARAMAVVLCRPVGYEAICTEPTYGQLARHLAGQGFPVLRFDYHGTGDSDGQDTDPDRVPAWTDSVHAAIDEARARSGCARVALLGVRLGATLALQATAHRRDVAGLVLWAPCPTGKAFLRELRAAGTEGADGSLQAMGDTYTAQTVQALGALDVTRVAPLPPTRTLVVTRDDLPAEGPLPKALRAAGAVVEVTSWPGYAAMVQEPRQGVLRTDTLDGLTGWLSGLAPLAEPAAAPVPLRRATGVSATRMVHGVREQPLRFGSSLFGIVAEPAAPAPDGRSHTGIVLLNVGGNYRVGPHRVYVKAARELAASGYRVLRMDLGGIGDSPPAPGTPYSNLYCKDSTRDVSAAIDALAGLGCRDFIAMGICSGSFVAFQSALVEPRIRMQVLMNSRLLEWNPDRPGDSWQDSMQQYVKSTDYYRRSLWKPEVWRRLLAGDIHVRAIARRFATVWMAGLRRAIGSWLPAGADARGADDLLSRMRTVCRSGTDTLMLVSDADDGRDYVEFHFGRGGKRLRGVPNFRMVIVPEADHTFSSPAAQRFVLDTLLQALEARSRRAPAPAAPSGEPTPGWLPGRSRGAL